MTIFPQFIAILKSIPEKKYFEYHFSFNNWVSKPDKNLWKHTMGQCSKRHRCEYSCVEWVLENLLTFLKTLNFTLDCSIDFSNQQQATPNKLYSSFKFRISGYVSPSNTSHWIELISFSQFRGLFLNRSESVPNFSFWFSHWLFHSNLDFFIEEKKSQWKIFFSKVKKKFSH